MVFIAKQLSHSTIKPSDHVTIKSMKTIIVKNLYKNFKKVEALQDINFEVEEGELFGIIGPDGAGKTTLFRILTTLLKADKGFASVNNWEVVKDYKKIRNAVGYMPGKFSLYQDLSIEENLNFFATIFGTTIEENYDLIKDIYIQIEPFKKRKAGKLSGGMKQKLALCCALIHKPVVLFLDEPTTGVDPVSRKEFWDMLKNLKKEGITILVSTPYMDEANLCDRVALMRNGKIMRIDTPQNLIQRFEKPLYAVSTDKMYQLLKDLRELPTSNSVFPFGDFMHYTDQRGEISSKEIKDYLLQKTHNQVKIERKLPSVEDCFMELMERFDG